MLISVGGSDSKMDAKHTASATTATALVPAPASAIANVSAATATLSSSAEAGVVPVDRMPEMGFGEK